MSQRDMCFLRTPVSVISVRDKGHVMHVILMHKVAYSTFSMVSFYDDIL